jgi:integrase
MGKLSDRFIKSAAPGRYVDGDGLMLEVAKTGAKRWFVRFKLNKRQRDMGLGPYPQFTLAQAREATQEVRKLLARGIDPIADREAQQVAKEAERTIPTFADIAAHVIEDAKARTANKKGAQQWERYLGKQYCGPLLKRPVNEITTLDVAAVLRPVWRTKPEAARKFYPAIRRVFEYARIRLRDQHGVRIDNPAIWDDLKAMGFEAPKTLTQGSHPSLPHAEAAEFVAALRATQAVSARMLEFLILTAVRTDAVRHAKWQEFDLDAGIWRVPLENLKDKKTRREPFRVPLSAPALAILKEMKELRVSDYVFPGGKRGPMSNMAMLKLLGRMNEGDRKWQDPETGKRIVPHGFRATFKTWGRETRQDRDLIEEALGHTFGDKVERAYNRTDVLELRRALMAAWALHCEPDKPANVVPIKASVF